MLVIQITATAEILNYHLKCIRGQLKPEDKELNLKQMSFKLQSTAPGYSI